MVLPCNSVFPRLPLLEPDRLSPDLDPPVGLTVTDPARRPALAPLAAQLGPELVLLPCWQRYFPQAGVLISSALCGGTFLQRVQEAAAAWNGRCWLLLEPMAMTFPLPCPTGCGTPAEVPPPGPVFDSEALCCLYTHSPRAFTLWDTENTLQRKLQLAREAGFRGYAWGGSDFCAQKMPAE